MGVIDDGKSAKSEKPSSPAPLDQNNVHVYPDWTAMQAYYGHQVPLSPYYNSAMASGHPPHPYMWGPPQHMMPPYGAHPYAAIYSHGGVYAHPGIPLGSHGHAVPASPAVGELAAAQLSIETPAKSSGNNDRGLMKKLKGFDGLAMSIGNGNSDSTEGASENGISQSAGTEGSSDGSDGNTAGTDQPRRKRSPDVTATYGKDSKTETQPKVANAREANLAIVNVSSIATPPSVSGKLVGTKLSPTMPMALELMNHSPAGVPMLPSETRSERDLKKERRKQSNRESARRSRLRKQAESEELAVKVDSLSAENMTLKSEMNRLTENSEKLRSENAKLLLYDKSLRTKALSVVYSCTSMLGAMSGVYQTETSGLIRPMLKPWMDQFSIILQSPVQSNDPDDWSIRLEVLKCLNQFVQNFRSLAEAEFMVIVRPLWQTYVSSLRVYELSSIQGKEDPYEDRYDSDGSERSLESFVIQLFEFLLTIVSSARLRKVVANNVNELAYHTIAFLQMTEQQVHHWSLDANQYVADEDDNSYSCRVSGALLLEEVISQFGEEGINAVVDAAKKHFRDSQLEKAAGSSMWWRIREATLFALASLSEQLLDAEDSGLTRVSLGNLLEQLIIEDIGMGINEYPFLVARVFSTVARFFSVISQGILEHFLGAAGKSISMDVPPPVKVGACRALSQLLPEANKGVIQPHLMSLFSSLTDLLNQASDETLHLVLETLHAAVRAGHEAIASVEPIISPIILNMWASHVSDPFISIDALEVLEAIKDAPGCMHPLISRILPYIGPILNKPQTQPDGLVAGSLDLVTMLLKNAPSGVVKVIYDVCFYPATSVVLQSDDHSEMQNATQCLAAFLSVGKQEVLAWGSDSGFTMRRLLDVASRLLDPDLESSGSLFVGSYILQLILHLPLQMAQHIRDLIGALVRRMQTCQIVGLRSSLILILARLVHMSAPNVEQFVDLLITIPAESHDNSFSYAMSEWTKQQGEIQGAYQIKVTTTALALLLSTKHAELSKVNVQGHLVQSTAGITTRSKAKLAPDLWSVMPLSAKILALLADALIEIQEQVSHVDDEDSDWEDIQDVDEVTDQNELYSVGAKSSFSSTNEQLDAMAKIYDENKEDGYEDDLLCGADPLNQINLMHYLVDFLTKFYHTDRPLFDHLCQHLTHDQLNALQMVLIR